MLIWVFKSRNPTSSVWIKRVINATDTFRGNIDISKDFLLFAQVMDIASRTDWLTNRISAFNDIVDVSEEFFVVHFTHIDQI